MTDREVSMGCLVAYGLWSGAVLLLGLGWLHDEEHLGLVGLAAAIGGSTALVRQYFVKQNMLMRNAYELGRDSVTIPLRPR